jgi:cellulose synthase/poly-beta-1,6-N-acetylglucosamine synthase-like glycosyltransferase
MNSQKENILPFISVVVPAYDEEKYLADGLNSLSRQTYPKESFEVIVVDNNSTDRTKKVAEDLGVKVVGCQVQGVANAREVGSRAAKGDIIAGTDADTLVDKYWLEKTADHFIKDPDLLGITGPTYLSQTNFLLSGFAFIFFGLFQMFNFAIRKPTFSGFNFAVRKDAYEKIGGINVNLVSAEDIDLSFRLAKVGRVKFFWDVVVYTSARRLKKNPLAFFMHNSRNYFLIISGKNPEPFKPIR